MPYKIVEFLKEKKEEIKEKKLTTDDIIALIETKLKEDEPKDPIEEPKKEEKVPIEQSSKPEFVTKKDFEQIKSDIQTQFVELLKTVRKEPSKGTESNIPHEEHKIERNKFEILV